MSRNRKRAVYMRAFEQDGYWTVKVAVDQYDPEGHTDEVLTIREVTKCPSVDESVDQAWLLLVTALHILERNGAMGRVAGADWPALPLR